MKLKSAIFGKAVKIADATDYHWEVTKHPGSTLVWENGLIRIDYKGDHAYIPASNVGQFKALEEVKSEGKRKAS